MDFFLNRTKKIIIPGSKSIPGIILSPRPTRRAFFVPSVLTLKSHIMGTRCCPVKGTSAKQLLSSNLPRSLLIAAAHSGCRMAAQKVFGTSGSFIFIERVT